MRQSRRRVLTRRGLTLTWAGFRTCLGLAATVAPGTVVRPWVGQLASSPGGAVLGRALGGRDLALAIGTLAAARHPGTPLRPWVFASGLADALDAVGTASARSHLPSVTRDLVIAASAASALLAVVLGTGPDPGTGRRST